VPAGSERSCTIANKNDVRPTRLATPQLPTISNRIRIAAQNKDIVQKKEEM
jgi:hypothetical protein